MMMADIKAIETGWGPKNYNYVNPVKPIILNNGNNNNNNAAEQPMTFGFELEWDRKLKNGIAKENPDPRADYNHKLIVDTQKFPFLAGTGNIEGTGNWEVQSIVFNNLAECVLAMKSIKDHLRYDPRNPKLHAVKSFHLHMRFPKEAIVNEREMAAWISRLGDTLIMWRLQYRNTEYTLDNWSQHRNEVFNLHKRGPVRLQTIGGKWDLEIRGCMSSKAKINQLTQIICTCLTTKKFNGCAEFMNASTDLTTQETLFEFMNRYAPGHTLSSDLCRKLSRETFRFDSDPVGRMNVVLWGLEKAPFLGEIEKAHIHLQNGEFARKLSSDITKYGSSNTRRRELYFHRLKKWATNLNLHHMLLVSLYDRTGRSIGIELEVFVPGKNVNENNFKEWMNELSKLYIQADIPAQHANYSADVYQTWLLKFDSSILPKGSGYEIVSPILFMDNKLEDLKEMCLFSSQTIGARTNDSTGYHIHVGLENLSFSQLKRICFNFLVAEKAIDLIMPSNRVVNKFCKSNFDAVSSLAKSLNQNNDLKNFILDAQSIPDLCERMNPATRSDGSAYEIQHSRRYYRFNLQRVLGIRTMEFRQHEGTLDYKTIFLWAKLILSFFTPPLKELNVTENARDMLQEIISFLPNDVINDYIIPRLAKNGFAPLRANLANNDHANIETIIDPANLNAVFKVTPSAANKHYAFVHNYSSQIDVAKFNVSMNLRIVGKCYLTILITQIEDNSPNIHTRIASRSTFYCRFKFDEQLQQFKSADPAISSPTITLSHRNQNIISATFENLTPNQFKLLPRIQPQPQPQLQPPVIGDEGLIKPNVPCGFGLLIISKDTNPISITCEKYLIYN